MWQNFATALGLFLDTMEPAVESARALGQHPPTAYAAMKEQLHRHAREAIDAGAELDANVRAIWKSDETSARVAAFLDALKRLRGS